VSPLIAPSAPRNARRRDQSGGGLVEVLVALAVMVPLVLGAATGLLTAVRASAGAQLDQQLQVALTNAGELVRDLPYQACSTPEQLQQRYADLQGPVTAASSADRSVAGGAARSVGESAPAIARVDYWSTAHGGYLDRCTPDEGAQRVTFTVAEGGRTATGTVVTRLGESRRGPSR
jgi:Tfp pilus assembly protein PilV